MCWRICSGRVPYHNQEPIKEHRPNRLDLSSSRVVRVFDKNTEPQFSISIQFTNVNVEEMLKDEKFENYDYICRIESEVIEKRKSCCFMRYQNDSNSENPIFDDELKKFQIYTEVSFLDK